MNAISDLVARAHGGSGQESDAPRATSYGCSAKHFAATALKSVEAVVAALPSPVPDRPDLCTL
jgi:hypothetical protein